MKFFGATLLSIGLASAATVSKKVSYDDWKVYRVNIGSDRDQFQGVFNKLQLGLWKGQPETSDVVDVVVPPSQISDFEKLTGNINTRVMHEDLGKSIADEDASVNVYEGMSPS